MITNEYGDYVLIFKALSDETRLRIVEMLSCDEMCACDILDFFEITQSTLSYHMKILTDCKLINSRKDGSWVRYSVNLESTSKIRLFWEKITVESETCICKTSSKNKTCD